MSFLLLWLYLLFVIVRPHEWFVQSAQWPMARYFMLFAFLAMLVQGRRLYVPRVLWLFGVVAVAIFLSLLFNGWAGGGFSRMIEFIFTAIIPVWIVAGLIDNEQQLHRVLRLMLVAGLIMVAHGISQIRSPLGIGWSGAPLIMDRATYVGLYSDPNDYAMYLLICLPIAFYFKHRSEGAWRRLFYWLAIGLLLYGIYLSNSRGALVGIIALLVTAGIYHFGWLKSLLAGALTAPVLLWAMSHFRSIDANEESARDRIYAWYDGFQMFLSNPLFGIGKGNFVDLHGLTAHNSFVLVLGELGLLGYVAWTASLLYSLLLMATESGRQPLLQRLMLFCLLAFAVTGFFLSRSYANIYYVLMGLTMAVWFLSHRRQTDESPGRLAQVQPLLTDEALEMEKRLLSRALLMAPLTIVGLYVVIRILL